MPQPKILVLHGPNLNLLGTREPEIYGSLTLDAINQDLVEKASACDIDLMHFQSNAEFELINCIHQSKHNGVEFLIFNPGAFTHTSVALRDAILGVGLPFIEVHLSNVYSREPFRKHSYFSDIAVGVICGLGAKGYSLALHYAVEHLASKTA
ncbi:type II 3-dehydroquinate dehydratase [Sessilibacter sp. MAH2]